MARQGLKVEWRLGESFGDLLEAKGSQHRFGEASFLELGMDFGLLGWVEAVEGNIEGEAGTLGSQRVATGPLHCGQWEEIEGVEEVF